MTLSLTTPVRPEASLSATEAADSADERLVDLVYRVACVAGLPMTAAGDLCVRVAGAVRHGAFGATDRAEVAAAIRRELSSVIDPARLDEAIESAILYDRATDLPPEERAVLLDVLASKGSIAETATRTGLDTRQAALLLTRALRMVSNAG